MEINEIYSAVGCPECGSGYRGRIAIHEVLLITQEIRDAISNNMPKDELRNLVYNTDVNTLLQDGLEKVINGYTTFEEIIKLIELDDVADDKNAASAYKYDLHNAIEQTELSKTSQLNVNDVKNSAKIYSPVTEKSLFKSDTPSVSNEPVNNVQTIIKPPSLDDTQVLDL